MSGESPLLALTALGQSVWLDYLQRQLLKDGTIARWIGEDGLAGITSNPAIFEKAIAQHHDDDDAVAQLARAGASADVIYETLVTEDVASAADLLRDLYQHRGARDGYVSLEVSPHLAHDTAATVTEARRLWTRVNRPNIMIKVPGTRAGLSAIGELIAAGINVNVTLLFSIERYEQAADAWLGGLEQHAAAGAPLTGVASVASFFLSRIDALVDELLDRQVTAGRKEAATLRGESAIACARLAYKRYHARVASPRWQALAAQGAQPQRLLWASTSTKDPAYHDLKYVESLIGPETVNTLTPETFAAFRDHGRPAAHLTEEMEHAHTVLARLAQLDIDMAAAGRQLEDEGVEKFVQPFDALHATLANRVQALRAPPSEAGL